MNFGRHCCNLLFYACAASMAVQAVSLAVSPNQATLSNILIGVMGLLATVGCACAARGSKGAGKLWLLLGIGFFLSVMGQLTSTYHETVTGTNTQNTALNADFLFFAYGIPILLAVCSGSNEEGLKSLLWLDVAQAVVAGALTYVQIFSALPAFGGQVPISSTQLMYLYNSENWFLAGAATLRMLANPSPVKKRFYENLALYLWVYAVIAIGLGYVELKLNFPDGLQDVAWGVPYLALLAALAFRKDVDEQSHSFARWRQTLSLLIDNLSPIVFTLAIVLMGVTIAMSHKTMAFLCITFVVLLYGIRAALLHGKYAKSQEKLTVAASALQDANDRLLSISITDSLTCIYNRRHFDDALALEWIRSRRSMRTLSLLMIDVDCFKALNDRYGHQAGDECLRAIAFEITNQLKRPDDLAARYGGEEFVVILPGADREGAFLVAENIRKAVEGISFLNEDSLAGKVATVSIGISSEEVFTSESPAGLIRKADNALYCAKALGRNRCRAQNEDLYTQHEPLLFEQ